MAQVTRSKEYERVCALPRRTLSIEQAQEWATYLTSVFAIAPGVELRPWQAQSIAEAVKCDGAWLALPVGVGKTLLCWLLPTAMQAKRTMLIVPATLLEKTYFDFAELANFWRTPTHPIRIETREKLAVESSAMTLDEFEPDLILIDEADDLSNASSAVCRRIDRYVRSHSVRVVAMTGTPARKSLMGYWHLLAWCLGDQAPVPLQHEEARMWALALDHHSGARAGLGPLGSSLRVARDWFRHRLTETPGVVCVDEDSCQAPLTVRVRLAREDTALDAAFERFAVEQENPGGIPVSDPLSRWLLEGQLGLGIYTRWCPPPPEEWRQARRAVARFVRERIDGSTFSDHPLDTEAQVIRRYAHLDVVKDWVGVKPTYEAQTETVWISRSTLDACHDWIRELDGDVGIVWCGSVDFGRTLAAEAKLDYYGPRGVSLAGSVLHVAPTDRSFVASWQANKKGFNLQPWCKQLIVMPPQSAKWMEQIIGRSHRAGQEQHVVVDVLATSGGTLDAFELAVSEASYARSTVAITQKILRADIVRARPALNASNIYRWATRREEK